MALLAPVQYSSALTESTFCVREFVQMGAAAEPLAMEDAKQIAAAAWKSTERYLRRFQIADTPENRSRIIEVYDRALSHELTPLGPARKVRGENGFRAVDAPQLEALREAGVPRYIIEHLTVDHHNSFGAHLPAGVNSTTQILDMLDSSNAAFTPAAQFDRNFRNFASDNIGDAFGLARAVARNANAIRVNPELRASLRQLAVAEDFGVFGSQLDLAGNDQLAALLRLNDNTIESIGPGRTFMDRVKLDFTGETKRKIAESGPSYDRVLLPESAEDRAYVKRLADEFRTAVNNGIAQTEKLQRVILSSSGRPAPISFADLGPLPPGRQGEYEKWVTIPQLIRKRELAGGVQTERNFNISGSSGAATRTVIMANLPGRGTSMMQPVPGQTRSFMEAFVEAEKQAIEANASIIKNEGREAEKLAQDRLNSIKNGNWRPQSRPDGGLIFGTTYMTSEQLHQFVENNVELLGYR